MNTAVPRVHKHEFTRLKEVMRACWERVGNWAERKSTCLEPGRRSRDPLVVQRKFMNPLKSYRQFPVSGVFSPRNLVLAFIRSSKGSVIQRIRNNWATG